MDWKQLLTPNNIFKRWKAAPPIALWTIKDIFIVISIIFSGALFILISTLWLSGDKKIASIISRYAASIISIIIPILWLKKKYGIDKELLGLRKGDISHFTVIFIGLIVAIIYDSLIHVTLFKYGPSLFFLTFNLSFIKLIIPPISISGFVSIILAPVNEEIINRGFFYGYLRKKFGITLGLFIQAMLFGIGHFNFSYLYCIDFILIGLMLGIIYETTGSLYPSMVCHGFLNYIAIIRDAM